MNRNLTGGFLGLSLAAAAALGLSGRDGFGEDRDVEVIRPPDREARVDRARSHNHMPDLAGATGWINTSPLTTAALRGKVILVEFGTFSCINWRRQLPYVRAWAQRYAADGLVVLGVHSPEFGFEHESAAVQRAAQKIGIPFPLAIDSDMAIWRAFDNMYWPALYFIDAQGRIRHQVFGEGEYESSEMVLRQLLAEAGHPPVGPLAVVDARGVEAAPDSRNLLTPEIYAGSGRAPRAAGLRLVGAWTIGRESAVLHAAGGRIVYRFHARDVHVVMGSTGSSVRFRVRIDGQLPGAAHGQDVDDQGHGTTSEPRLYHLIRQPGAIIDREIEIEILDAGAELFSFTFG